jgi:hypothetical protein
MTFTQDLAVDFGDPERKTLLTGTHGKGVYRSTDAGATFVDVGTALPIYPFWPWVIDAQTYLVGTYDGGVGPNNGIHRSTDAGENWSLVSELAPSHDGGFVGTSDGALYFSLASNVGLGKSTDAGATWTALTPNLPFGSPAFTITPVELPNGKLATIGSDHLLLSADGGTSWEPIGEPLPFEISPAYSGGLAYSPARKTFFIWHSTCSANAVLEDGIMSAGYDYAD